VPAWNVVRTMRLFAAISPTLAIVVLAMAGGAGATTPAVHPARAMAAIPATSGARCPTGRRGMAIGANMPLDQDRHIVVDIDYLYDLGRAPGTHRSSDAATNADGPVVGYVYTNDRGQVFVQFTDTRLLTVSNALTPREVRRLFGLYPRFAKTGKGSGPCFVRPYAVTG